MGNNEILFQLRRLERYIESIREVQTDCREEHECHWVEKLNDAQDIATNVIREFEIQEGERLAGTASQ